MTRSSSKYIEERAPLWAAIAYLVLVFALGGGSRGDIDFLLVLRPASVAFLAYGLWGLRKSDAAPFRVLYGFMAALFLLVVIHLIPLPPALWQALPGRALAVQIDHAAGIDGVWRPITLVPPGAWNALFALIVPLTMLVLASRLHRAQLLTLLLVILAIGSLSGLLGLFQRIGPNGGPLYFYQITNADSAVGLFANRNHQAALLACMFPILAAFASTGDVKTDAARQRRYIALLVGVLLVPMLLMTASRAGLVLGIIGLLSVPIVYVRPAASRTRKRKPVERYAPLLVGGGIVAGLGLLTYVMARGSVFDRLLAQDPTEELRWQIWGPIVKLAWRYFPFGSGIGSFVEVFEIDEPRTLIDTTYVNHAHNDFLEIFLTGGLPAVLLAITAFVLWLIAARDTFLGVKAKTKDGILARVGVIVILLLALASMSDYPLRVPSLACFLVLAAVWATPFTPPPPPIPRLRQFSDSDIAPPRLGD